MAIDYSINNPTPFLMVGDVIQDYIEFSGENPNDAMSKIRSFRSYTKEDYHRLKNTFYKDSKTYIYDILSGNPSKIFRANVINQFIPNALRIIKDHSGKTFCDFGGGTGTVCSIVAEWTD